MSLETLMAIKTIEEFEQHEQIDIVGNLLDLSFDDDNLEGIEHAFKLIHQIDQKKLNNDNYILLHYDIANGYGYLRKMKYKERNKSWLFQVDEITKEIFHLRKAIISIGFESIQVERKCQIYNNLGNVFSFIGRFVEAQDYWNRAIEILPEFAMAIGNKGNGMHFYGKVLYDSIHCNLYHIYAYHYLKKALCLPQYLNKDALTGFQYVADNLEVYILNNFPDSYLKDFPELNDYDLGSDQELKEYRLWCLDNKLFVNPLNDLGSYSTASHDCLNLPTITMSINKPPVCLNLFNQIKQEFATARYSFYISLSGNLQHISDMDVPLVETMETIRYSYYIEQLKISFRLAYSILDKIAYLLNDYLELGVSNHEVSFRKIWYSNINRMELRNFFKDSENWALRGLYWLSKDLYEKDNQYDIVLEPESREIALIRNYIEHKGFKVVSEFKFVDDIFSEEDLSYNISRSDFENKTLKLLKLTRAAIIYLAISISHEEKRKEKNEISAFPISSKLIPGYMRK